MKISLLSFLSLVLLTSCDRAQMGTLGAPVTSSGREKLSCGLKSYWGVFDQDQLMGVMTAYKGSWSSSENYNYHNLGPHFKIGPRDESKTSGRFFFYQGTDGLSFQFSFGEQDGQNHPTQVSITFSVKHNKLQDDVIISDEPDEFIVIDRSADTVFYQGLFNYQVTIDGAAIGPIVESSTEISGRVLASTPIDVMVFEGRQGDPVRMTRSKDSNDFTFTIRQVEVDPCLLNPQPAAKSL